MPPRKHPPPQRPFRLRLGLGLRALLERARALLGPRKHFTILILPHSRPRFRKLHLSHGFVITLGLLAAAVAVAGLWAPHLLFRMHGQSVVLQKLERENERLRNQREVFESALAEVAEQLEAFEAQASRLADELDVDELPSARAAAGGPDAGAGLARRFWFDDEVRSLRSRTEALDRSLGELDGAFRARMRLLASTPNMMPIDGWFSHGYGWRKDPFTGGREFHRGMDIVAPSGTEIQVTADGLVTRAARNGGYGKCVDVAHGYGYVTRYAHMSEILVRPGQRLRRGDVIGRVGSTGRSTAPHLHYEVFRDGRQVNPWKYLGHKDS